MGIFRALVLPTRLFQTMPALCASVSAKGNASHVKKESLRELRRRTGYSFSSCKEALIKFDDDLQQAEVWLEEQAKERGWNKTTQLQTRVANQGLIGFLQTGSTGVLVEVNCETDFVARTARFRQLVQCVARAVFEQARRAGTPQEAFDKSYMGSEELVKLPCSSSSSVEEQLALCTGKLGERMAVRRACWLSVPSCCYVGSYVHGTPSAASATPTDDSLFGKYAAMVVLQPSAAPGRSQVIQADVGRKLAQHVVGMAPLSVGEMEEEAELERVETSPNLEDCDKSTTPLEIVEEETRMLQQPFLLDPTVRVAQLLRATHLSLLDFVRFECGEKLDA